MFLIVIARVHSFWTFSIHSTKTLNLYFFLMEYHIFCNNGYPGWFINNTIKKFEKRQNNPAVKYEPDFLFTIGIPFFGKASRVFEKRLTALVKTKFNVDINVYYTCFKTGSYFQLKCSTPFPLLSNVVYKFSCSRDANISYIGMTTRHHGIRIQEHLHHKTIKSAIREHFEICQTLLIKKHNPQLHRQLYANGSSFLLNVY